MDTILNQPNRRRVSTDRPNRIDSQLISSLEGESGPTPAGKTPPTLNQVLEGVDTLAVHCVDFMSWYHHREYVGHVTAYFTSRSLSTTAHFGDQGA